MYKERKEKQKWQGYNKPYIPIYKLTTNKNSKKKHAHYCLIISFVYSLL